MLKHHSTKKNKFIGIRCNPKNNIKNQKKQNSIKYNFIITSNSLRSKMTKKIFFSSELFAK